MFDVQWYLNKTFFNAAIGLIKPDAGIFLLLPRSE